MDLPAAEAAKLVKRLVPEIGEDGNPTGKDVGVEISASDVLSCRVRGDVLVVVTTAGEKLTAPAPKGKAEK
ncbi:hypothetical protein [Thauera sp.]|uniref:hypothetical protein n=1 Tax=Thauera sp. TaxID=1905334 RepID=UPI0039E48956